MLEAENLCRHSALDALIASSVSQSADSVVMLELTVSLRCVHQTVRDNIALCELDNKRLADAVDSAGSAPPIACQSAEKAYHVRTCRRFKFSQSWTHP